MTSTEGQPDQPFDRSQGYVRLWRKALGSRVFCNAGVWQVWCWCLMKASYRAHWVDENTFLEAGQFVTGRRAGAKEVSMKPNTFWKRLLKLKTWGNLDIKSSRRGSIITVCNWERYQTEENGEGPRKGPLGGHRGATEGPLRGRYKKVKKGKKRKEGKEEEGARETIPPELDTEEFRKAWSDWEQFRREKGHKLTTTGAKRQLKRLAGEGVASALLRLDRSITNDWRGLWFPDDPERLTGERKRQPETMKEKLKRVSEKMERGEL